MIGEEVIFRLTIPRGDVYPLFQLLLPTKPARTPYSPREEIKWEIANLAMLIGEPLCRLWHSQPVCLDRCGP